MMYSKESAARPSSQCGVLNRLQSRCVVRLTQLIGDVLGVGDTVVSINHKDRPLQADRHSLSHTP